MLHRSEVRKRIITAVVLSVCMLTAGVRAEERVLFGFDDGRRLSAQWSAVGKINAKRETGPAFTDPNEQTPSGNAVSVDTEGQAGIFAKSGTVAKDWSQFGEVSFWVHRSPEEAQKRQESVIEVQVYEPSGRARFWRRVSLAHTGWQEIRVPLKWFRWGTGKRPMWEQTDRFGFWFRDPAVVAIDRIAIRDDKRDAAAYFSVRELTEAAFAAGTGAGRVLESEHAVVLTNAENSGEDKLLKHLDKVVTTIRADEPTIPVPVRKPMLIVFADRQQYENFAPTFARNFNSTASAPKSTGFTFHGIATSFPDSDNNAVRPTYTHEFIHSWLTQSARISNSGEWFQEGMASMYQLRFHPQDNIPQIVREGLENENYRAELSVLCNGERIPSNRYWQAATVIEMLHSEPYQDRWPLLLANLQSSRTTSLEPHLETVLKTDWQKLTDDWMEFCRARYVSRPPGTN